MAELNLLKRFERKKKYQLARGRKKIKLKIILQFGVNKFQDQNLLSLFKTSVAFIISQWHIDSEGLHRCVSQRMGKEKYCFKTSSQVDPDPQLRFTGNDRWCNIDSNLS